MFISVINNFIQYLAMGPARQTLQILDLSSTFVTDADLAHVAKFRNLKELQLNDCHLITSVGIAAIAKKLSQLEVLGLRHLPEGASRILIHLLKKENHTPLPKLRVLNMESDVWIRHIDAIKAFTRSGRHPPLLQDATFAPELDLST